jgi:uncharacterized membrane protein (DUF4010 family)
MEGLDLLHRLGVALAIGLVVGIERHWEQRDEPAGQRTAGVRTFALIGLLGAAAGALAGALGDPVGGGIVLAGAFLAFSGALGFFQWREAAAEGSFSVTGVIAGQVTFALGTLAVLGDIRVAGAAAVAIAALLASRGLLHGFVRRVTWAELRSALLLLAMTFVALPLIPDGEIAALGGLNPARLWLFAVILAAISFAGYVAVKLFGARRGRALQGAAAGLASSTAVAIGNARLSHASQPAEPLAAGALVAGAVSYARTLAIVAAVSGAVAWTLWPALVAGAATQLAAAILLLRRSAASGDSTVLENPFELRAVLQLAALLGAVDLLARLAGGRLGDAGIYAVAALSGLADVDAVSLAMGNLVPETLAAAAAAVAIAIAVAVNTLAKAAYGLALGTRRFALELGLPSALALAAGAAALALAALG